MAQHAISRGAGKTIKELMKDAHEAFKEIHGAGKSTTEMSVSEMHLFYTECQRHSILMLGVSGMDEDSKEFDHGFTKSE